MTKIEIQDSTINIVTYHYVRPIKNSKYPNIKGLEFDDFKKQINFFQENFNIISQQDFIDILHTKKIQKKPSFLLTFDDGLKDHYQYVFPYLVKKKISACFYPPIKAIENKIVLNIHKIHFILEKELNRRKILDEINSILIKQKYKSLNEIDLKSLNLNSRYDDADTVLIKKLLQYYLPPKIREILTNELFEKIIDKNLNEFPKELYMSSQNLKEMYSENMSIGPHGNFHFLWQHLNEKEQEDEIKNSIRFFFNLGFDTNNISLAYPHGSYNNLTLNLLKKYNLSFALTTNPGNVNKNILKNKFTLPRYDTNDFI